MIRPGRASDTDQLLELVAEHAAFEQSPLDRQPDPIAWRLAIAGPAAPLRLWVAEQHGSLVGYAAGSMAYSTWHARAQFNLDALYLAPGVRGTGLGRQLMASVRACAEQHGCRHIEWVTPVWNEHAIGFYRSLGTTDQLRRRFRLLL